MPCCDLCGNPETVYAQATRVGLYQRIYQKRHLCRSCFLSAVEKKIHNTIKQHRLIEAGDFILMGMSGGKDSQLMASTLSHYREKVPFELAGITVDEGIAGYRPIGVELARELARSCGIRHLVTSFQDLFGLTLDQIVHRLKHEQVFEDAQAQEKTCAFCARLRLKVMMVVAKAMGANKLGLAINFDDHVANFLLTLGTDDMATTLMQFAPYYMPFPSGIPHVKALTFLTDKEIALYDILNGIPYQLTPECPYSAQMVGDLMREQIFRIEETFPGFRFSVHRATQMMRPLAVQQMNQRVWVSCPSCFYQIPAGKAKRACSSCELIGVLESLQQTSLRSWETRLVASVCSQE